MKILEKIVGAMRLEIAERKRKVPVSLLEKSKFFQSPVSSLEESLAKGSGIIAEFKRRSPSRGIINSSGEPGEICASYLNSGASAVSVLTNGEFFGGNNQDLLTVREKCNGVILRKEFIIDDYQVIESKSIGADAILLIADILSEKELKRLSALARSLEMEILFEIHDEKGTDKLPGGARLIGVNSRNLDNFIIDMDIPRKIISKLPETGIKIAESGIHSPEKLMELREAGFKGFLIGELFMKENDPGEACNSFIGKLNRLNNAG
jgi:indole-3-glycerol phosphate synthase